MYLKIPFLPTVKLFFLIIEVKRDKDIAHESKSPMIKAIS